MVASCKDQPAVDLVRQHKDVAISDGGCNLLKIVLRQDPTRRILWRIQDDHPSPIGDESRKLARIERKIPLFLETDWNGASADVANHRFIDGESGIGVEDLVAFVYQGKNR